MSQNLILRSPLIRGAKRRSAIISQLNYLLRIGGDIVQRIDGNKVVTNNPSNT